MRHDLLDESLERAVTAGGRRGDLVTRDDMVIDAFRSSGRLLNCGVEVRVPALPRTTWAMTILRIEAKRDRDVRKAYDAVSRSGAMRRRLRV